LHTRQIQPLKRPKIVGFYRFAPLHKEALGDRGTIGERPDRTRAAHERKKEMSKFFVRVIADSRPGLLKLQKHEFDLFQPTSKTDGKEFTIEGLLTLEEIGRLVEEGYRVLVEDTAAKRSRAHQTVEFTQFLKAMEE
jgi:hypothetical protein